MAQKVTIQEYFNLMKEQQKKNDSMKVYPLAKAYWLYMDKNEAYFNKPFREFIKETASSFGWSIRKTINYFAHKRLRKLIEDDLMECAAEVGVCTREAILEDDANANVMRKFDGFWSAIDDLNEIIDTLIVPVVEKPENLQLTPIDPFQDTIINPEDYKQVADDDIVSENVPLKNVWRGSEHVMKISNQDRKDEYLEKHFPHCLGLS